MRLHRARWFARSAGWRIINALSGKGASIGSMRTARALHKDDEDRKTHEEMGFLDGWGRCLEQLVGVAKQLKG